MSEISSFRSTDLPARPPSSFGQRNFEKSVSSASRSSTQINRYPFLCEAANDQVIMTSPNMTREHLSSQRSSSRASSRKLPTTRVDKPSPIPEVGLSKSADFDKIASNENHVDGKNIDGIDNYRRRRVSWLGTLTAAFN